MLCHLSINIYEREEGKTKESYLRFTYHDVMKQIPDTF